MRLSFKLNVLWVLTYGVRYGSIMAQGQPVLPHKELLT